MITKETAFRLAGLHEVIEKTVRAICDMECIKQGEVIELSFKVDLQSVALTKKAFHAIKGILEDELRKVNDQAVSELQSHQEIDEEAEAFKFAELLNNPEPVSCVQADQSANIVLNEMLSPEADQPEKMRGDAPSLKFTDTDLEAIKKAQSSGAVDFNAKPERAEYNLDQVANNFGLSKVGLFVVGKNAGVLIKGRRCNIIGKDSAVKAGFIINLPGSADCLVTEKGIEEFRRILSGGK